jgi:hypothetical protein
MLLTVAIRILESMFVLGVLGSAIVVILTSIEDFRTLFKKDTQSSPKPVLGQALDMEA